MGERWMGLEKGICLLAPMLDSQTGGIENQGEPNLHDRVSQPCEWNADDRRKEIRDGGGLESGQDYYATAMKNPGFNRNDGSQQEN